MSKNDDILRLLIAEESLNDAEMLISVLRNAGHAVRATRAEDDEDAEQALSEKPFDLFLCSTGMENLSLDQAVRLIQRSRKDIPLVAIADAEDSGVRREVMRMGAADLVTKNDLEHLSQVMHRELRNLRDRRRLRRLEASLRETEKRCHALLDSSRDAIAYVHEGMHIYANHAYLERFEVDSFEDIEGMPILDMIAPADQGTMKEFLRRYNKGNSEQDELELSIMSGGEPMLVALHFSPASIEGEPCTQIMIRDHGSSRELEAQLDSLSKQDLLSGLYNRPYFMEQLDRLIGDNAEGTDGGLGLLYVHIDNLDSIQQTMGITGVDLVISDTAGLVKKELDDNALAARFGDEVFTIVLKQAGVHETIALGEAIRHAVEAHVAETGSRTITTTCSIGVAMIADGSRSAQQAVEAAHQASEAARQQGGNRVHLPAAAEDEETAGAGGADLQEVIEQALKQDRFYLVYQPVASLHGDTTERYEVRIRMTDEDGNTIMPSDFIGQAEALGVMPAIDRWVTRNALDVLAKRHAQGHDGELMIKLSGPTLGDEQFLGFLAAELKRTGVDGTKVVFQLNEPVAVTQLNQAKATFRGLKELRCGFSLDHFGSGLNPFQLVKHLPADYLKLDTTLTANISTSEEAQEACKQTIETAHSMHKKVIAGYLEDASSMAMLWQYGADFVQGNFLQEPEPEMHYDFSGMVI